MKMEDIVAAVEMGKMYLKTEAEFDEIMMHLAPLFIMQFLLVANDHEWPIMNRNFPDVLRAIALILEDLQEKENSKKKKGKKD